MSLINFINISFFSKYLDWNWNDLGNVL